MENSPASMPMKCALFLILALLYSGQCCAQSFHFEQYTVEDGLPSSEVYSAFQDSKGYMWFASDAGVSRFNGYGFEVFDSSDGLADNTIFLITDDKKDRIWFGSFSCQLSYFENEKIHKYEFNEKLKDHIGGKHLLTSFNIDDEMNIWMGFGQAGLLKIDQDGTITNFKKDKPDDNFLRIIQKSECLIYGMFYDPKNKEILNLEFTNSSGTTINQSIKTNINELTNHNHLSAQIVGDTIIFQPTSDVIYYFIEKTNELKKIKVDDEISSICNFSFYYGDGLLNLCTNQRGVYQCAIKGDSLVVKNHFLDGNSVSRMLIDRDGGYWFLTVDNGIHYTSSFLIENDYMQSYLNDENQGYAIEISREGKLYVNRDKGIVIKNIITEDVELMAQHLHGKYFPITTDAKLDCIAFLDEYDLTRIINGEAKKEKISTPLGTKKLLVDSNHLYLANSYHFHALKDGVVEYADNPSVRHFHTCLFKNGNEIWAGTNNGVRVYKNKKISLPFSSNKYLSSAITSMERLDESHFLVGTKSFGILVIKNNAVVDIINKKYGLIGNLVRTIHVDEDGIIWAGTNKGISRIVYAGKRDHVIHNITQKHGLSSIEIIDLCSFQNKLYVLTRKGVSRFDKTKLRTNTISPNVYITSIKVNSIEQNLLKSLAFEHGQNYIQFNFESLNYRNAGEVEYQYRLLGVHSNWISTKSRSILYPSLDPNDYSFQVRAKNEDGVWSAPESMAFSISPPFWCTWWFISLEVFFSLLVAYMIFMFRLKQLKFKNENKRKIAEADKRAIEQELTALRAQMNPHFIFNSLSAIRNAINNLDKSVASNYTVNFGQLIRMVLESSKNQTIEVNTEIEMLNLYLGLEAMRFSDKFSYSIINDPSIDADSFHIPTMVIQPFVENAILHGLVPKESDNLTLDIVFSLKNETELLCTIKDNGVGRIASQKINEVKNLNKKSMGMQITTERLNLYYKDKRKLKMYTITDLHDENGVPSGTQVEITFPL
ncbi:MAG: ligand-binding sensor domain-containing protein/two-component sensor histidine kinase [Crocinitomicaceae bacterium]|jgi:ligand-binding sensor domain-containing protein/two-component sensor histidine kinase